MTELTPVNVNAALDVMRPCIERQLQQEFPEIVEVIQVL